MDNININLTLNMPQEENKLISTTKDNFNDDISSQNNDSKNKRQKFAINKNNINNSVNKNKDNMKFKIPQFLKI